MKILQQKYHSRNSPFGGGWGEVKSDTRESHTIQNSKNLQDFNEKTVPLQKYFFGIKSKARLWGLLLKDRFQSMNLLLIFFATS